MKSSDRVIKLASSFKTKLSKTAQDAPVVSQKGTTELFFDSPENQQEFGKRIQDPNGKIAKYLTSAFMKLQKPISMNLQISATPGANAAWLLAVNPPELRVAVSKLLDEQFKEMMHQTMAERLAAASAQAKAGSGSEGALQVGSLDLE